MKVYLCYQCTFNGAYSWRDVTMVTSDKLKAMEWVEEFAATEYDWREYEAEEVK